MIRNVFFIDESDGKSLFLYDYKKYLTEYNATDMQFNDETGVLYISSIYSCLAFDHSPYVTSLNRVKIFTERGYFTEVYALRDIDNGKYIEFSKIKQIILKEGEKEVDELTMGNDVIKVYTEQNGSKLMYSEGDAICLFALLNSIENIVDYRKGDKTAFTEGYMKVSKMTQGMTIKPDWQNVTMEKIIIDTSIKKKYTVSIYAIKCFFASSFYTWCDLKEMIIYGKNNLSIIKHNFPDMEDEVVGFRYNVDKLGIIKEKWKIYKHNNTTIYVEI